MIPGRWFVLMGLSLAVLGLLVGLHREAGLAIRTAGVLMSVIPGNPPTPLQAAPAPSVREVGYQTSGGIPVVADLYEPVADHPAPGVVLVNGLEVEGRKYGTLVTLAGALARAGFVVLVPDGLDYANYRLLPEDVDALVAGFQWLAGQPSIDPARIGFVGFSTGGSLALMAASDSRIANDVVSVAAVGSYYSLDTLLQASMTEYIRDANGALVAYPRHPYVWGVVRNTLVTQLPEDLDQWILFQVFPDATPEPNAEGLAQVDLEELTPAGRAVFDLFTNRDPKDADLLLAYVRALLPTDLDRLSPETQLDGLRAPVHLLHQRGDAYIPVSESVRLERRLGGAPRARLTTLDVLEHVELSAPDLSPQALVGSYVPGMWALFSFTFQALNGL